MSGGGVGVPIVGLRLLDGRTGSTLLMQLLGTAPEIAFDRRYPAEYRWASYFARMAAQITAPFDEDVHLGVTPFFFGDRPAWGPVPFHSEVVDVRSLRAPILRALWVAWSAEVPDTRFYAEKLAVPVDDLLTAGLDVRVVDLVRDPRDLLASIRAFGLDGQTDVKGFVDRLGARLDVMQATSAHVDRVVVRYEDLVADLDGVAERLGAWLGVDLAASSVEVDRQHMTSPSPAESVGRWQRDLAAGEAEAIAASLGPALAPFGYELE